MATLANLKFNEMSVEVRGLTKVYGSQRAVDNISFSLAKGEIVGFLGPNGAGKSTTMKMITGYLEPDGGQIHVSGIDVQQSPLETKKRIGYLPESNALYYDMYVREYLQFIAGIHHVAGARVQVEQVIETVGLTPESNKKIGQLSKGYKQRVGIAAALLHSPEVLILDEPTSGLDPNQIVEIRQVIKEQGKDKIVLFSSHILQEVEAICDRVIIINKGKIVADDQLSNLRKRSTTNVVKVSFQEPLEAEWLRRLPDAKTITKVDTYTWSIETDQPDALRKEVLEMALQHNLNINSLQNERQSLEEVFRLLTSANNG
ncbi:gliding motility-associated ABC transporter ATP-binding subunit GldA [Chitinophagaceae bacterium LB-8]|uniref:Gliding motility-associated ABC transporter ATP-binding subunit GldA n=1 Tax=Paraflavisolibacter caeni TaxID=2982496 RepID=A0A9X3B9G2_9BACT|nr:gliding motility-associated ABC transporter ATP-binding subunit GldA [Paraflavisolibacter caeni]MCU7551226.1 gliding motility-associated ABC transporter ATP-binding subunit GldA [Paraflavisolibacter caeni]